jgi:hypothetical protein
MGNLQPASAVAGIKDGYANNEEQWEAGEPWIGHTHCPGIGAAETTHARYGVAREVGGRYKYSAT